MKHKIALLADVHGNATALKAVIKDSMIESVTDYWLLGDLIMPDPGSNDLFEMLESINVDTYVQGNLDENYIKHIKNLPLQITKQVNDLSISISHNLQNKNYGGDLWPTNNQEQFDRLFDREYDIANCSRQEKLILMILNYCEKLMINTITTMM